MSIKPNTFKALYRDWLSRLSQGYPVSSWRSSLEPGSPVVYHSQLRTNTPTNVDPAAVIADTQLHPGNSPTQRAAIPSQYRLMALVFSALSDEGGGLLRDVLLRDHELLLALVRAIASDKRGEPAPPLPEPTKEELRWWKDGGAIHWPTINELIEQCQEAARWSDPDPDEWTPSKDEWIRSTEIEDQPAAGQEPPAPAAPPPPPPPAPADPELARLEAIAAGEPVGTCSVCGEPQYVTPSGETCTNGHGGAAPAEGGAP